MQPPENRVLVAMSGGVDSSVAACLLHREGFDVIGVFMTLLEASEKSGCCSLNDKHDAFAVAERFGFKFEAVDFTTQFAGLKDYFINEYERGRTPNPCILCNKKLKFDSLVQLADHYRCQYVATGHYVRTDGRFLYQGVHAEKDQAYALALTPPALLPRLKFPLGDLRKDEVRVLAEELELVNAAKKDSQDICFVHGRYQDLIPRPRPGRFVTSTGEEVGRHDGYQFFTRGQRRGIGIAAGEPLYVLDIRPETAEVVVGTRDELRGTRFCIESPNWYATPGRCEVQCRYHGERVVCEVEGLDVHTETPINAVPGQLAVFYDDDRVLGGAYIGREPEPRL